LLGRSQADPHRIKVINVEKVHRSSGAGGVKNGLKSKQGTGRRRSLNFPFYCPRGIDE
jgi:hypothetical protein